nr:reverse transcriptase domain-containing protein [Tanacetum cinerariifolium]
MRTRSQSRNNFSQQKASPAIVEPLHIELPFLEDQFQEDPPEDPPEVSMADNRTMAELLQAPTEGYEDAIVIPEIAANNFELKHARIWLEKETPRSILTWDDLVTKFINQFFPPLKITNLRNEITRFQQRFDESLYEAWDRFNDLLRACPHHGFSELHQLDTFYNALNVNDQDSLNSAAVVAKVSTSSSTPSISSKVAELKDMVRALLIDKKNQSSALAHSPTPAPVKAVEPNCVTYGGTHSYQIFPLPTKTFIETTSKSMCHKQPQLITTKETPVSDLRWLQIKFDLSVFFPIKIIKTISINTEVVISSDLISTKVVISIKANFIDPRRDNERRRDQTNEHIEKFYKIFKDTSFEISFTDALILMPKFASTLKALIGNKEKLSEMARTSMNEHCSAVIRNKLPRKLGDPGKFLIPCEFPVMDECLALADLGASINLMPLSVWEGLSLPELTPTCMTLELSDRSRVLLILRRCFLKTGRALIDVHKGELTLRIRNEAITYNLDQTARYSANYNQMMANKIVVIYEEYSQEVLGFFDVTAKEDYKPSVQHQRRVNPKIHDVIKKDVEKLLDAGLIYPISDSPWVSPVNCVPKNGGFTVVGNEKNELILTRLVTRWQTMDVFMDDFSIFGNSFENCLSHLDKMLQRCEDTNLCLNWEKSHFMVKEGIVLGHKIFKNMIEVDRAKVDVIAKLPHPITVKDCIKAFQMLKKKLTKAPILIAPNWDLPFELMCDASDFAIGAVLGQRHEKHFRPIHYASKTMNDAESNYTTTEKEMLAVVYAFEKFWSYLIIKKA